MLTHENGVNKRKDGSSLTQGLPQAIQEYLLPLSVRGGHGECTESLANRIKTLGREQRRIRDELGILIERVGALGAGAREELAEVSDRVVRLVDDLKSLDDQETELLQSAYWRETGVGD